MAGCKTCYCSDQYDYECTQFRCLDEVFFTWNGSDDELEALLTIANVKDPYIQIQTSTGSRVNYLDAQIDLTMGMLRTDVRHECYAEPYALPMLYDQPAHPPSISLQSALIRTAKCCSQVCDFHDERQLIEISFAFHRFSSDFIAQNIDQFFMTFNATAVQSSYDQAAYEQLRQRLFVGDLQRTVLRQKRHLETRHQRIWYIHSTLKGEALMKMKRKFQNQGNHYPNSTGPRARTEIVGIPPYPANTK